MDPAGAASDFPPSFVVAYSEVIEKGAAMATTPRPDQPQPVARVASQLNQLGLSSDVLRDAALAGHADAISCTTNDVGTRSGYVRWATPLRYLGDHYAAGWTRKRPKGFELLVNPERNIGVGIVPGDRWTGVELDPVSGQPRMPHSRIDRGPVTAQLIVGNRDQTHFGAKVHPAFASGLLPGLTVWLLLHHVHRDAITGAEELRLELSVPVEFYRPKPGSDRGLITRFAPRLILPAILLEESALLGESLDDQMTDDRDEGDNGTIDIDITRR